jgi:Tol biopolymer transport system component
MLNRLISKDLSPDDRRKRRKALLALAIGAVPGAAVGAILGWPTRQLVGVLGGIGIGLLTGAFTAGFVFVIAEVRQESKGASKNPFVGGFLNLLAPGSVHLYLGKRDALAWANMLLWLLGAGFSVVAGMMLIIHTELPKTLWPDGVCPGLLALFYLIGLFGGGIEVIQKYNRELAKQEAAQSETQVAQERARQAARQVTGVVSGLIFFSCLAWSIFQGYVEANEQLSSIISPAHLAWSPDGDWIAFSNGPWDPIYVMTADGSMLHTIGGDAKGEQPTWSPDSSSLAFTTTEGQICIVDTRDDNVRCLADLNMEAGYPAWSPDGESIAFLSQDEDSAIICIVGILGDNLRCPIRCSTNGINNWPPNSPAWSPDGTRMIVLDCGGEEKGIYIINVDGGDTHRLTETGHCPAWSQDGSKIIFQSSGFRVIDIDAGRTQLLANRPEQVNGHSVRYMGGTSLGCPTWSPDRSQVALVAEGPDENEHIYVMDIVNGNTRRLTDYSIWNWLRLAIMTPNRRQ